MMDKLFKIADPVERQIQIELYLSKGDQIINEDFINKCLVDHDNLVRCDALDWIINNDFEIEFYKSVKKNIDLETDLGCLGRSAFIITLQENHDNINIIFSKLTMEQLLYIAIWYEAALYLRIKNQLLFDRISLLTLLEYPSIYDIANSLIATINRKIESR